MAASEPLLRSGGGGGSGDDGGKGSEGKGGGTVVRFRFFVCLYIWWFATLHACVPSPHHIIPTPRELTVVSTQRINPKQKQILHGGITGCVHAGEMCALMGPSGAGTSTTSVHLFSFLCKSTALIPTVPTFKQARRRSLTSSLSARRRASSEARYVRTFVGCFLVCLYICIKVRTDPTQPDPNNRTPQPTTQTRWPSRTT